MSEANDRIDDNVTAAATGTPFATPTIVIHDDSERVSTADSTISPVNSGAANGKSVQQDRATFNVITTPIPTGTLDDPFSSRIQFSNRGSVLLGSTDANAAAPTMQGNNSVHEAQHKERTQPDRLRHVSADDRRLSRRVRSLYEPEKNLLEELPRPEPLPTVTDTGDSEEVDVVPELLSGLPMRPTQSEARIRESKFASALGSQSDARRDSSEAAGGVEDWTGVDSQDVDRWGFVNPRSASSRRSSMMSTSSPANSDEQRVTRTSAAGRAAVDESRAEPESALVRPKGNRLSLTPGGKILKTSPSILSNRSKRSTTSRMASVRKRSGKPRWLIDAPDMLFPPPGLEAERFDPHLRPGREAKRADKWQNMARQMPDSLTSRGSGTRYTFNTSDPKLISRVWKGIPDRWRSAAWYAFLTSSAAKRSSTKRPNPSEADLERFFSDCQEADCVDDVQIDMDVPRTIGNHLQFRKRYHGGQRFLFRVLRALSLYFPDTGYVQGMASVAATLLVYYEESRAFVMAVRLWQLRGVRKLYSEGFVGLMAAFQELEERWIGGTEVHKHLETLDISTSAWGPKWYLTLFNYVLPFHTTLRVWDVFMLLGDPPSGGLNSEDANDGGDVANYDILHAASAALLSALGDMIVDAEFENAMKTLTGPVNVGMDDKMMLIARKLWTEKRRKRR